VSAHQIYAAGDYCHAVTEPLPPLKALLLESTGLSFRRIGRFIQLSLIGAARARPPAFALPEDTAVYLASGDGDLEMTLDIMNPLFRDGQLPKPLNFVNTVSNASCFYVAQLHKLRSRSNFACNRFFAFESVLQLAALDLDLGVTTSALVGSVDLATVPLDEHRQRIGVTRDVEVGEGSHWLWLGAPSTARPRLGELLAARHLADRSELLQWIVQQDLNTGNCLLAGGQFLDARDFELLRAETGIAGVLDYRSQRPYYDCQSGAAISEFLRTPGTGQLLHINADTAGRYSAMLVSR
jgi:hypothetical protein